MNKNDSNNTSGTNWEALTAISDETIDYSDIPPLADEFFERATIRIPAAQVQNLVHLDPDVMQCFQSQGVQPTEMINTVDLRRYIENNTRLNLDRAEDIHFDK